MAQPIASLLVSPYAPGSSTDAFGSGGYAGLNSGAFNAVANEVSDYTKQIWAREDSAYQRMVADMKKAGLNPWTGVSSGGSPTSATNPASARLDSLLGMLNYNLDAMERENKYKKGVSDSVVSWLKVFLPFMALGF